jgi:hypothetical protein
VPNGADSKFLKCCSSSPENKFVVSMRMFSSFQTEGGVKSEPAVLG